MKRSWVKTTRALGCLALLSSLSLDLAPRTSIFLASVPWPSFQLMAVEEDLFDLSLDELVNLEVTSSSMLSKKSSDVFANLSVVTQEMIRRRGYRNIVELLQDIPGFDFSMGDDGGGEYTSHSVHRGIGGDNGNSKILIMVDGVVQNMINSNWSTLWTNEMMLGFVKRVEIIQGPGAVIYGSNAVSGIIHFIMDKDFSGLEGSLGYGSDQSRELDVRLGKKFRDVDLNFALHHYASEGDGGDRYDPGAYFHGHRRPSILLADYDASGQVLNENVPNPRAGERLVDGFKNDKDDFSAWLNLGFGHQLNLEVFYWSKKDGLSSYVPGYEYVTHGSELYQVSMRGYHISLGHDHELTPETSLDSRLVYRVSEQDPNTGFVYTYRFSDLEKTYHSFSSQAYLEERLRHEFSPNSSMLLGLKVMQHQKMPQTTSLGQRQASGFGGSQSDWDTAVSGGGLNVFKANQTLRSNELALYAIYDRDLWEDHSISLGLRWDHNDQEFGSVLSPRLGWQSHWNECWTTKLMFGEAFRQPSTFEYYDEFRGDKNLQPEKARTYEIENLWYLKSKLHIKQSAFFTTTKNDIHVMSNRYQNGQGHQVRGLVFGMDFEATRRWRLGLDGIWTEGKRASGWGDLEHVSPFKLYLKVNHLTFDDRVNIHISGQYVSKTKAPASNAYMWRHYGGYAPAYHKLNLTMTFKKVWNGRCEPQLRVTNLLDRDYFTLGRQDGDADVAAYQHQSNQASAINPPGFIPAYHPQAGRRWMMNFKFTL